MQGSSLYPFQPVLDVSSSIGTALHEGFGGITPLLDLGLTESNSQGAYLHYADLPNAAAKLVAWSGISPIAATVPLELQGPLVKAAFSRNTPLVLQEGAWEHAAFGGLPEFRKNRFEGVVSVPLLESGQTVGLLNVCRAQKTALKPRELSFLLSLSVPIGALLTASSARLALEREVEKLTQQLADRKILERAKGLIQSRFEFTEEQAYYCIRNLSRRRRTPMRQIAEEVIATKASGVTAGDAQLAARESSQARSAA